MFEAFLAGQLTWNIPMLISLVIITNGYILFVKYQTNYHITPLQISLCFISASLFYLLLGSPLQTISHLSFTFHMTQMSILYFFVPPLFLLCIPKRMIQYANRSKSIRLSKVALYLFAGFFLLYHLPYVMSFFSQHTSIQTVYELFMFLLAIFMWHPLFLPRYADKKRYAFQNGILLMPSCMVLILAALLDGGNNPMLTQLSTMLCLPANVDLQPLPPPFNTRIDQLTAGFIMLTLHKFAIMLTFKSDRAP